MFKQAVAALLISAAYASTLGANTRKGRALLQHAKVITPSDHLRRVQEYNYNNGQNYNGQNQQQQNWNNYDGNQQAQNWYNYENEEDNELELARLSIKYLGCSEFTAVDWEWQQEQYQKQQEYYQEYQQNQQQAYNQGGYNGQQQGGYNGQQQGYNGQQEQQQGYNQQGQNQYQNQQYYNQNGEDNWDDGLERQSLVRFTLCTEGCETCSGEYAVDLLEFVDAYTESKLDTLEYQCEMIRERCYCGNGNWEQCFYDCYKQAEFDLYGSDEGVQYCLQEYYGQEQFELQTYLECAGKSWVGVL